MKLFRDLFSAIMIGVMGGFLFCVVSYYQNHKEGGILQTASAVVSSFDRVVKAYDEEMLEADNGTSTLMDEETVETFDTILNEDNKDTVAAYSGIVRFHVRANSNSAEDQALKMAVKEDVLQFLKPQMEGCENVNECKNIICDNLQNIYTVAKNTLSEQGYDYPVSVYLTKEQFPAKVYGDLTFPAGKYQALRIDIGRAEGDNWWCVMFPPLCFVDSATAIVTEEGKDALKHALSKDEYDALLSGQWDATGNTKDFTIEGESWIYNWWKDMKK